MDSSRRSFLRNLYAQSLFLGSIPFISQLTQAKKMSLTQEVLEAIEGKSKLIKRSYRPANYETPVSVFNHEITPNDQFFVRWHYLPENDKINSESWKLLIQGDSIEQPFEINFAQLKNDFKSYEVIAVCQCAGNRRGFSKPRVPGVQWGSGAMGNAVWKGARLVDVLAKAKIKSTALEVYLSSYCNLKVASIPEFRKSIPYQKALDPNILIAYEMNGEPLPYHNGYPVRLVIPGWAATYWTKQLKSIAVSSKPINSYWMNPSYRIPKGTYPLIDRFFTQENALSIPVTELVVNSLITNIENNQKFKINENIVIKGIAWDGGYGINSVEVSIDNGQTWTNAKLGKDLGNFSWRHWTYELQGLKKGKYQIMAKATNKVGATQTFELLFNQSGYHNNVVQKIQIDLV